MPATIAGDRAAASARVWRSLYSPRTSALVPSGKSTLPSAVVDVARDGAEIPPARRWPRTSIVRVRSQRSMTFGVGLMLDVGDVAELHLLAARRVDRQLRGCWSGCCASRACSRR